jgi:SAM-dependent methyltransferase
MLPDLRERSNAAELMDDLSISGAELARALQELRVINRLLGSAGPTIEGVAKLWSAAGFPRRLHILDVGAGSGDVNRALLHWADRRRIDLRITLVDIHPQTCKTAAAYYAGEPRVRVICADLRQLALQPADIVTASLFTHHFSAAELPAVYRAMLNCARMGIIVNDLHRHWLAWLAIRLATRLLSNNRMIRHDAPLSVQRGFRRAELRALQHEPELADLQIAWRPWFRYLVIGVAPASG